MIYNSNEQLVCLILSRMKVSAYHELSGNSQKHDRPPAGKPNDFRYQYA